jgi:excisionase family DNA binding protein
VEAVVVKVFDDIELLKVEDIAKALGTHVITIRRYIRSGRLKAQKVGRNYYVSKENFRDFINGGVRGLRPHKEVNRRDT